MDMQYAVYMLNELYQLVTEAQAWNNAGEQSECRMMLDGLSSEHRDTIIQYRDDAIQGGDFTWAIILSHIVYAMTNPDFYLGKTVELSVN